MGNGQPSRAIALVVVGSLAASLPVLPRETAASTRGEPRAPTPASWRTWVLPSSDLFRVGPPSRPHSMTTRKELRQIRRYQEHLSKRQRRLIKKWSGGPATLPWTEVALDMLLIHRPGAFPTRSARIFGLLHVGVYDAVVAAWDSRVQYRRKPPFKVDGDIERLAKAKGSSYPDVYAAVAGAAERLLAYLYPNEPTSTFTRLANQATRTRMWAGVSYRSDVVQGRALGNRVGEAVIAYGESDGHKNPADPVLDARLCSTPTCDQDTDDQWVPTPFHYQYPPTDPAAATWRTWLLQAPSQFRPSLPYAYNSPEFCAELKEVYDTNNTADQSQRQLAFFWDDGPGTYSPGGHWNDIAVDVVRARKLSTERTALLFSVMNAAIVDAFIAVWEAKYAYWTQRPVTALRERPSVCGGQVHDPGWLPNIITPPFPAFPSGHSGESAAAARVLQYFFPEKGQDPNTLPGNYASAGSFDAIADEVAFSRLVGGIHYRADNEAGLVLGRRIADLAIQWLHGNGAAGLSRASPSVQPAPPTGSGVSIPPLGPGEPYPSQIDVSGLSSSVKDVNVTLTGLSHAWPDDIDAVLMGPGAQSAILMSDVGGGPLEVSNVDLTLDDEAAGTLPDETQITSGTFRPTDSDTIGWDSDELPAPAPAAIIASLSVFDGTNPNGTWNLFINDDYDPEPGILQGWSLEIHTSAPAVAVSNAKAKEGKVARFTLARSLNLDEPVTASYTTAGGSAKGGKDFKKTSGTVTFAPGETSTRVRVKTRYDHVDERTERLFLKVTSGGVTTKGTARIIDND